MKKRIDEVYSLACALHAQLVSSPVAQAFAKLWDEKHPNRVSTQFTLEKLRDGYSKMRRLAFVLHYPTAVFMCFIVVGVLLAIILNQSGITISYLWYVISLVVLSLCLSERIYIWAEDKIDEYCSLTDQIEWIGQIDYSMVKTILDPLDEIKRLCSIVVMAERNGLNNQDEVEFNDRHGSKSKMCLYDLRRSIRQQARWLAQFGIITGDLKPHFEYAEYEWLRQATNGRVMTDFQI